MDNFIGGPGYILLNAKGCKEYATPKDIENLLTKMVQSIIFLEKEIKYIRLGLFLVIGIEIGRCISSWIPNL